MKNSEEHGIVPVQATQIEPKSPRRGKGKLTSAKPVQLNTQAVKDSQNQQQQQGSVLNDLLVKIDQLTDEEALILAERLANRSNMVVSKAIAMAQEMQAQPGFTSLAADLAASLDRLL